MAFNGKVRIEKNQQLNGVVIGKTKKLNDVERMILNKKEVLSCCEFLFLGKRVVT